MGPLMAMVVQQKTMTRTIMQSYQVTAMTTPPPGDNPVLFTLPWSKDPNYNEIITMRFMSNLQALPGFKHHHGFKEQKDASSNTSLSSSVRRGRPYYVSVHPSDIKLLDPKKKPMLNDVIVNAVIVWQVAVHLVSRITTHQSSNKILFLSKC